MRANRLRRLTLPARVHYIQKPDPKHAKQPSAPNFRIDINNDARHCFP